MISNKFISRSFESNSKTKYYELKDDFLQCTGLKDMFGVDIYESDVVSYIHSNKTHPGTVEFMRGGWHVSNQDGLVNRDLHQLLIVKNRDVTITHRFGERFYYFNEEDAVIKLESAEVINEKEQ